MKQIILSIAISLASTVAMAQTNVSRHAVNYEAANWKTWLLDNPQQITIAPPPAAQSKVELQSIKQVMARLDAKKMEQIKYWDAGSPSYRWNQIIIGLVDQKPETQLRMPASWMNIAIYDATILAWKEKLKYKRKRPNDLDPSIKPVVNAPLTYSYPCEHSVTAAAAAYMLAYFFPAKADSIMQMAHAASQSRVDAGVQFQSDAEAGWKLGEQVAKEIIEKVKNDGSAKVWDGKMNKDTKKWTGTFPMGIMMGSFSPIVIRSADQFRLPPPPDFENDMKDLKNFKRTNRSNYIALYWVNNGPGLWNDLASQKMFEYRIMDDAPAAARIYTVLTVAYHDAAIAIFDSKYAHWGIRPNQYDTTYKPLVTTPPFPGYPSGHAAGAATTAAVLEYFFPADAKQFWQLAQECADSRFYAGIHFKTDNESALKMGNEMGKYIVNTWMNKQTAFK
ncbi:MAG TPA: phosphatase PAP2 family protein [Chitinophagaceae bacterium]|nr:phosphatase PAP2 family protein [Chitinophagaceae bacterium]